MLNKLSATLLVLLSAQTALAGRPACSGKTAAVPLMSAEATGTGRILLKVGNGRTGSINFLVAPAESNALESLAGKSLDGVATDIRPYLLTANAGLLANGTDQRAQILTIGQSIQNGHERFLAPGRSYKILAYTLIVNCPTAYDSKVLTVKMPDSAAPQAPQIKLRRLGYNDIDYGVTAASGIRSNVKIRIDGVEIPRSIAYGMGEGLFQTLPDSGLYRRDVFHQNIDRSVPHDVEIEAEAIDGSIHIHKETVPAQ